MPTTFVTALIDLEDDQRVDKPLEKYIELFRMLNNNGLRFHLFLSPNYRDKFEVQNGVIEYISLTDLDTYKHAPLGIPDIRTVECDTRNFLILLNAKSELMCRAIQSHMHHCTHYAWIDIGICHMFRTPLTTLRNLQQVANTEFPASCLYIPGCWEKQSYVSLSSVNWRFCGPFFLGDKQSLLDMKDRHDRCFPSLSNLTWEVNVWAHMEQQGWTPTWYKADHDDSILNVPYTSGIVRVPSKVPLYWDGGYSRCHVGSSIESYVQQSVSQRSTPVSAIFTQSDGMIEDSEFDKMIESLGRPDYANSPANKVFQELEQSARLGTFPIICMLCSRNFQKPNMMYMPLDDQTFEYGLQRVLSGLPNIPWEQRKPIAFWRGGSSGCERPTLRHRVLDCLFAYPHADVRFTPGGWEHNDKALPQEYFTNERVGLEAHIKNKYILIVDGNCIASAHQWVFGSGSVPIMITHPGNEYWFKKYLKPMVNYVPIKYDLSDLKENIDWLVSHDEEAKQIADNAMQLSQTMFTPEFQRKYIDDAITTILAGK